MENKTEKILFFTNWYPNDYNKISGVFIKKHALAISKFYKVAVFFVFSDPNLKSFMKFEVIKEDGISIFRYSHRKFKKKYLLPLTALLYLLCSILGYFKILIIWGKANINHVHVLTRSSIVPLIVKKLRGTPYFISEHWSRYLPNRSTYNGFLRRILTRYIVKESAGISTVSQDLKRAMLHHRLLNSNFVVINNVVDTVNFRPHDSKKDNEVMRFLHVSGLTDSIKNVSGILRVVKQLQDESFEFIIDFIGNDPDRLSLEDFSNFLGLQNCVFFHGELYGNDLVKFYQEADAFVMFSNFENQPCVLIESFCCGLPVIATEVGGIPEIVNSSNGLLVNAKDELALKNAMQRFLQKQVSFDSDEIRKEALKNYSYEAIAEKFKSFYNNQE